MLLVSFLLVIVATIFLLSGLFLTKDLALIFISIACSAVAGIVLVVAVMKSRPRSGAAPAAEPGLVPAQASVASAACGSLCADGQQAGTYVTVSAQAVYKTLVPYPAIGSSVTLSATSTARIQ